MIKDIKKPTAPNATIPIAETFAVSSNSFLVGFFKTNQTRLHLTKKDFVDSESFII